MYTIRVEADFAAAHYLSHYHGKCERLHGHNYLVRVHAAGPELDEGGMLMDFGVLKGALRAVLSDLDHSNLNELPVFGGDPSAERIARHIHDRIRELLPDAPLSAVEVFETPTSVAAYIPQSTLNSIL